VEIWISKFPHCQISKLLRFPMRFVAAAETAVLAHFQPLARLLLVLGRAVIPPLTFGARQGDDVSHG
jgi:hypothetical protein